MADRNPDQPQSRDDERADKADPETIPAGISNAAVEGARFAETSAPEHGRAPDSRTVDRDRAAEVTGAAPPRPEQRTEQSEAPLGGAPVAFPAPSAQPSRVDHAGAGGGGGDDDRPGEQRHDAALRRDPTSTATIRRAVVDVGQVDEDDDLEWRRAGGADASDSPPPRGSGGGSTSTGKPN
ncbi:MAG TPA: hypothetical protein VER17_05490 [Tepidisphaeraceae bacterium]|nr:hypothetical protein [Tepidisphaeraceae bacterium]